MAVAELQKGCGEACPHEIPRSAGREARLYFVGLVPPQPKAEAGCGIYGARPASCRDFYCFWLAEDHESVKSTLPLAKRMLHHPTLRDRDRPDRCGVMLDIAKPSEGLQVLVAREVREGAFDSDWGKDLLHRLAKKVPLILVQGDKRRLIGPVHLVEKIAKVVEEKLEARRGG
jgi:hypothetical protein